MSSRGTLEVEKIVEVDHGCAAFHVAGGAELRPSKDLRHGMEFNVFVKRKDRPDAHLVSQAAQVGARRSWSVNVNQRQLAHG